MTIELRSPKQDDDLCDLCNLRNLGISKLKIWVRKNEKFWPKTTESERVASVSTGYYRILSTTLSDSWFLAKSNRNGPSKSAPDGTSLWVITYDIHCMLPLEPLSRSPPKLPSSTRWTSITPLSAPTHRMVAVATLLPNNVRQRSKRFTVVLHRRIWSETFDGKHCALTNTLTPTSQAIWVESEGVPAERVGGASSWSDWRMMNSMMSSMQHMFNLHLY